MIERLVHTLRSLAAPAEVQLTWSPSLVARGDELARDYADALRLTTDCPQLQLSPVQREALERLDEHLEGMSGPAHAALWTGPALREAPEWTAARRLARAALRAIGEPADHPASAGGPPARGSAT